MIVDISSGYDVAYYTHYIGEMKVHALDVQGTRVFTTLYKECWPKTIGAIELGWESTELVDFTIDIGYSWWTQE